MNGSSITPTQSPCFDPKAESQSMAFGDPVDQQGFSFFLIMWVQFRLLREALGLSLHLRYGVLDNQDWTVSRGGVSCKE
jgi:hypothetical protein